MAKKAKRRKKIHIKKRAPRKEREEIPKITLSKQALTDLITELVGAIALPVVEQLQKRRNVSEFTIAEKVGLSINQFRHIIYKLDAFNLVSSTRRKDKQKGWYVYYWTFHPERLENLYWELKRKKLAKLKKRVGTEETTSFYVCPNKDVRVPLTEAMELNFRCPECGKLLQEDKTNLVKKFGSEIESIEKELKEHSQKSE